MPSPEPSAADLDRSRKEAEQALHDWWMRVHSDDPRVILSDIDYHLQVDLLMEARAAARQEGAAEERDRWMRASADEQQLMRENHLADHLAGPARGDADA